MKSTKPSINFVIVLGLANLLLITPLRPWGVVLLTMLLPGWRWAGLFIPHFRWPTRWVLSIGLSFAATILTALLLHYLPGPITLWQILLTLDLIAMLPLVIHDVAGIVQRRRQRKTTAAERMVARAKAARQRVLPSNDEPEVPVPERATTQDLRNQTQKIIETIRPVLITLFLLISLFVVAGYLRFTNLGYSEFQGDEALVMTFAADALEGHEDALFLRSKGPAELLMPLTIWRLNGTISELAARVPFAVAGLMAILTFHFLVSELFSFSVALYSTTLFAGSGLLLGFSRIVQYQSLVIWMGLLALWAIWRWRRNGELGWMILSGLFAGIGLLAHYDALLILPVLGWVMLDGRFGRRAEENGKQETEQETAEAAADEEGALLEPPAPLLPGLGAWVGAFLISTLPFYVPFLLDPQANRTGSYLSDRIGEAWVKNNLGDFLHFNSFYSSFYYVLLMGLLLITFMAVTIHRTRWGRWWGPIMVVVGLLGPALNPEMMGTWTVLPYAAILFGTFWAEGLDTPRRTVLLWFALPFLGYNFAVAQPLTHIYTIIPGWAVLAGWVLSRLPFDARTILSLNLILTLLFGGYLWNAFVRTDIEFLQDYPAGNLALYPSPYSQPPETGFFGFVHKSGWKTVGGLLASDEIQGDYDSNEEEDITSWYTRHTPRACDPGAEFYFLADDLIDPVSIPADLLAAEYQSIGTVTLPNGKSLTIQQRQPTELDFRELNEDRWSRRFDSFAVPSVFARTPQWQADAETNFGNQVRLLGYDLDTRRAYPGGRVRLTLYWQAVQPLDQSYKVFVHLDPDQKYAQADSIPSCARYPTNLWRPGQIIADHHALNIAPNTPLGTYPLAIGLYRPDEDSRLDILDANGAPIGSSLNLADIKIEE